MIQTRLNRMSDGLVVIFIGLVLICGYSPFSRAASIKPDSKLLMPDFRWQDGKGENHSLTETHGKPRLLHFWAAWCIPCREEMPKMLEWQNANSDILVIPLSLDQRMAQSKFFIKKFKLDMPPLLVNKDDRSKIDVPVLPFTLLVSEDGNRISHVKGIANWEEAQFSEQVRQHFTQQ
ncbi:MAG: TlpA family protein disulfide reductase [Gammaproteobacteria bacterium]|nr:TlpA family protein disulfide reductase [Gammaproteobacteria bacterium]